MGTSYPTISYPEYDTIDPVVRNDESESLFVRATAAAFKDVFDDNWEVDQPERDMIQFAKPLAVHAAMALEQRCEGCGTANDSQTLETAERNPIDQTDTDRDPFRPTMGEIGELGGFGETVRERRAEDVVVTPKILALTAYSRHMWRLEDGARAADMEEPVFVLLHDYIHDLADMID